MSALASVWESELVQVSVWESASAQVSGLASAQALAVPLLWLKSVSYWCRSLVRVDGYCAVVGTSFDRPKSNRRGL